MVGRRQQTQWRARDASFQVTVACSSRKGRRDSMEDALKVKHASMALVAGVFDGHYGARAAKWTAKRLPRAILEDLGLKPARSGASRLRHLLSATAIGRMESGSRRSEMSVSNSSRASDVVAPLQAPSELPSQAQPSEASRSHDDLDARLATSFQEVDADWLAHAQRQMPPAPDGTTAVLVIVDAGAMLATVANVGDSRAVACHNGQCIALSRDHRGTRDDERERIESLGGHVSAGGRVRGKLAVTRALGDLPFKQGLGEVICRPECASVAIDDGLHFILLACDGVWDVLASADACRFVQRALLDGSSVQRAVHTLVQHAYDRGSEDNLSAVLLVFDHVDAAGQFAWPCPLESDEAGSDDLGSDDPGSDAESEASAGGHSDDGLPSARLGGDADGTGGRSPHRQPA